MSYLQQILQTAQQQGGLTDEQFNAMFGNYMPQQPVVQQGQNLGMPQQPTQRPQMIQQTQVPMKWGTGLNTMAFGKGKSTTPSGDDGITFLDQLYTANKYDTDIGSEQTMDLAREDKGFDDWKTNLNDGLMSLFN